MLQRVNRGLEGGRQGGRKGVGRKWKEGRGERREGGQDAWDKGRKGNIKKAGSFVERLEGRKDGRKEGGFLLVFSFAPCFSPSPSLPLPFSLSLSLS